MSKEVALNEKITQCWTETNFNAKNLFELTDTGNILLKASDLFPERTIANIHTENPDVTLHALIEKFKDVHQRVEEIQSEWEKAEDKLRLSGKVVRLKEYLLHANALGDFYTLFSKIKEWENELNTLEEKNYQERLALIQEAEQLQLGTNNEEWKEVIQKLKDISDKWKTIGYTEKHKTDQLWSKLEQIRDKFFEQKRLFLEEQEKEMLRNLDLKIEIVEKAEQLATSENWKEATEQFKVLLDEWKSIGRTPHERNEELWNRYIQAKNTFYDRKKAHFEKIQAEQEANYALKLVLVERAEAMKTSTDWQATTRAFADLMEEWKSIGKVPPEKTEELWNRLNSAKDYFFNAKRTHLELVRVSLDDNYAQKLALLKRAEDIKNSSQWREITEEMNELMEEWKKIGPVPRQYAQTIWEQFLAARKHFFDRKDAHREYRRQQAQKQEKYKLEQTTSFLQKLEQELEDEKAKIADFNDALSNITPGSHKEEELRNHLSKLLEQSKQRAEQKEQKIASVRAELEEINQKAIARKQEKEGPSPDNS